ncbi:hypothetical protein [Xenorhabdus bovienii]|uniref:Protelomerase TelK-like stirrup domain-containing protein n=1 Tax=Xenorhabdus bovienii TaxID=40576 RepID=A0A0B6XGA1_XENBV|nr:hypothetical protein [Xenorhabdus bovienii]CDM92088.1 protein of unknown function [Xenorhabdus bovienii]
MRQGTKQIVETYPNDLVTSSQLRTLGFNIPLTKRYLEFAADALEQEIGENGRYQRVDNSPNIIIQDDEDEDEDEELDTDIIDNESIEDDEIEINDDTAENGSEPEQEPEPNSESEEKLE